MLRSGLVVDGKVKIFLSNNSCFSQQYFTATSVRCIVSVYQHKLCRCLITFIRESLEIKLPHLILTRVICRRRRVKAVTDEKFDCVPGVPENVDGFGVCGAQEGLTVHLDYSLTNLNNIELCQVQFWLCPPQFDYKFDSHVVLCHPP